MGHRLQLPSVWASGATLDVVATAISAASSRFLTESAPHAWTVFPLSRVTTPFSTAETVYSKAIVTFWPPLG